MTQTSEASSITAALLVLRETINEGKFPRIYDHFGGAGLIITNNPNRNHHEGDVLIITPHASALSWLVVKLKHIYESKLDYLNKYDFYPSIGKYLQASITASDDLFETMLYVVDRIEEEWA